MRRLHLVVLSILTGAAFTYAATDQDTYTNPILHSDYSDPDAIYVNGHYWMTSSSFNCVPGLQILHSTDLVNWEIVGAALPHMYANRAFVQHGDRVWAPSIRYFDGLYWIFWGDPDSGIYQVHTDNPCGEWSKPLCIKKGQGMIDTCPLLDDDGRVYLVHGWAGSRAGFKSVLSVCELNRECTEVIGNEVLVFDGNKNGNETVEGPKFYKRNGWYYIFAPAGGVKEGWQLVMRSRSPYGPYEWRKVLHQGTAADGTPATAIHGPHQGAWIEDAAGDSWFLHFEDRLAWGRVVHLQPMKWGKDDWCTIGKDINGDGIGEPVSGYRTPAKAKKIKPLKSSECYTAVNALETCTGFPGPESLGSRPAASPGIPLNWQWHAEPGTGKFMMDPSDGALRMNCSTITPVNASDKPQYNLWYCRNMLLEKVVGPQMTLETKMVFRPSYEGDRAGMIMMGLDYSTIEMYYDGTCVALRRATCQDADKKERPGESISDGIVLTADSSSDTRGYYTIYLKAAVFPADASSVREGCLVDFLYSLDGKTYKKLGSTFTAREGKWIGAKIGFFATAAIKKNNGGYVEIH